MRGTKRLIFLAGLMLPYAALEARTIKDWQVLRSGRTCLAMDRAGASAGIGVGVTGKEFMLTVWAPEFPLDSRKDYKVALSFDEHPDIPVDGYRYEDMLIISFERGKQAYTITHSSQVTVTVEGHSHRYPLNGLLAAAGGVARCAHVPTLSAHPS